MALASFDWPCCSPANKPCSYAPFNTRRTRSRIALASRLALNLFSVELRLQDPLDSARRPSVPTSEDEGEDQDADDGGNEDHGRNNSNGSTHSHSGSSPVGASTSDLDSQIDERERMRRERIGLANKGRTPWNKGKHHSPATIARLRERNKIVMQDPKIREKLRQHSHPQSQETREKLRIFMKARMQFERRQLTIVQEWKDSIAEIARVGVLGDDELQWDSYLIIKAELRRKFFAATKRKKKCENMPRSWTLEQRLKISESVRRKWADPEYRKKVMESIHETRQRGQGRRIFKETLSDTEFDNLLNIVARSPVGSSPDHVSSSVAKVGSYNDPLWEEKLKKIKLLRVRSAAQKETEVDTEAAGTRADPISEQNIHPLQLQRGKQNEIGMAGVATYDGSTLESGQMAEMAALQQAQCDAAEKAWILLAEAERAAILAAQALDAAGAQDKTLSDSLLEAWMLLDEANKSILNMDTYKLMGKHTN